MHRLARVRQAHRKQVAGDLFTGQTNRHVSEVDLRLHSGSCRTAHFFTQANHRCCAGGKGKPRRALAIAPGPSDGCGVRPLGDHWSESCAIAWDLLDGG